MSNAGSALNLKQCPFCGVDVTALEYVASDCGLQVECSHCDARGPSVALRQGGGFGTEQIAEAADAWNERKG